MVFGLENPVWKLLKASLSNLLGDKFSVLKGNFKGLLSSTENDLIAAIQGKFYDTKLSSHLVEAKVGKKDDLFTVYLFPIEAMPESPTIRDALGNALMKNVDLNAARREAGFKDDTVWGNIIQSYSADFLRASLPYAITRMIDEKKEFGLGYFVIDLAKHEAVNINGNAEYRDLVVLCKPRSDAKLSQIKKAWKNRSDKGYEYKRDQKGYDGFKGA